MHTDTDKGEKYLCSDKLHAQHIYFTTYFNIFQQLPKVMSKYWNITHLPFYENIMIGQVSAVNTLCQ